MQNELPKRKQNRLQNFDYSTNGAYFITICTQDKKCILGNIVGVGVPDDPQIKLSEYGKIVYNQIIEMNKIYNNVNVEKFIVMPNHLHLLIEITNNGSSGTPTPTNSVVPSFVSTLKRFTNKKIGKKLWQRSFYDHIIRNEEDYLNVWEYINNNPAKWTEDKYYNNN